MANDGVVDHDYYDAESGGGIEPPTIDLSNSDEDTIVKQIYDACYTWGFFQVINHGISQDLVDRFKVESTKFFKLPMDSKKELKRNSNNSRGYFDDELTKQKRDWKEAIDIGMPGSRDWNIDDQDIRNACLDGYNQFPPSDTLPDYRSTFVEYYTHCELLSDRLAILMAKGLGVVIGENGGDEGGSLSSSLVSKLRTEHTSYLRTNYYPPHDAHHEPPTTTTATSTSSNPNEPPPSTVLGISPHKDAGFLTVLLQDDDCHSLQVAKFPDHDETLEPEWITVHPTPNALTINTGDMAMIWSNGRYKAPLHRVLTNKSKERISAPFFYNPGFTTIVEPLPSLVHTEGCNYHPCCWG